MNPVDNFNLFPFNVFFSSADISTIFSAASVIFSFRSDLFQSGVKSYLVTCDSFIFDLTFLIFFSHSLFCLAVDYTGLQLVLGLNSV
jgi:choline-glycine betaine transporter